MAEVAERAGVKIPRNKLSKKDSPPNAINAVSSLRAVITTYGDEVTISALQCVTETGDSNPHMLKGVLIRALAEVLSQRPLWRESGDALFRAFDDIDYQKQIDLAQTNQPQFNDALCLDGQHQRREEGIVHGTLLAAGARQSLNTSHRGRDPALGRMPALRLGPIAR